MTFSLGIPQIIWLVLVVFNITYAAVHNGQDQPKYNVWTTLVGSACSIAILYFGGFFN